MERAKSIEAGLQNPNLDNDDSKVPNYSLCEKIKLVMTNITVEPILICYTLPSVMSGLATQNLSLEKACRVDLGFSNATCNALMSHNSSGYTSEEEVAVQSLVATAAGYRSFIQSLIPAALLMFLGSWSDRHNRRKPCILFPIAGEMMIATALLLCTYYFYELGLIFNVLAESIPSAITGGWFSMYMATFSYIGSVTTPATRTLRIGAVNMFLNVSFTIGIALSGILYIKIGYYGIFSLALCLYILAFIYGFFRVKEAPMSEETKLKVKEADSKNFFVDFFDFKHVKDTLQVAFKDGKRNRKKRICTIMVLVMVIIGPMHGEYCVAYLFVRYKFKWSELDYSMFSTYNLILHMTGTIFSLAFFSKYLKLDDTLLGLISCTSKILSSFVYAFAPTGSVFYTAVIVEMLNGTSFIAMRSIISKLVPQDELGKIYSLFGVSEALMPLLYGPMYSMIYKATIDILPGAFYLAGGFLTLPAIFIFFWLYTEHKNDLKEDAMAEEKLAEEKKLMEEEMNEKNYKNYDQQHIEN